MVTFLHDADDDDDDGAGSGWCVVCTIRRRWTLHFGKIKPCQTHTHTHSFILPLPNSFFLSIFFDNIYGQNHN